MAVNSFVAALQGKTVSAKPTVSTYNKKVVNNTRGIIRRHPKPKLDPIRWDLDIFIKDDVIVVDFETKGTDVLDPEFGIVGVGLASKSYPNGMYLPVNHDNDINTLIKLSMLVNGLTGKKLVFHNANFDSRIMDKFITKDYTIACDTLVAYRMIGSEDAYVKHGLKNLAEEVLGWTETQEVELDNWLMDNGHITKTGKPDKAMMYLAPDDILGKYCALDAQSTLYLYEIWLKHYVPKFPAIKEAMELTMDLQAVVNEAFFRGLAVDKNQLEIFGEQLDEEMGEQALALYSDDRVKAFAAAKKAEIIEEVKANPPKKITKKDGTYAAAYYKWKDKISDMENEAIDISQLVTISSNQKLIEFLKTLYEIEVVIKDNSNPKKCRGYAVWECNDTDEKFTAGITDTGGIQLNKNALVWLGDIGKIILTYRAKLKTRGYVDSMLDSLDGNDIHNTDMKPWSSLNGRPTGGSKHHKVNILQSQKIPAYMNCLVARQGYNLIEMDYNSLEPTILAETSRDPSYLNIYANPDYPSDAYIEFMNGTDMWGEDVKALGYPALDSVKKIKKQMKKQRSMSKPIFLGLGFGMGADKLVIQLKIDGFDMTREEVDSIVKSYWRIYPVLKQYQDKLQGIIRNQGYYLNALGVPRCLNENTIKDVLNSQSQGSGNMIQMKHSSEVNRLRKERGVEMYPIIASFYDELVWEVKEGQEEAASLVFTDALANVNEWLDGDIPIAGEVEVCKNFTHFKCN